MNLILAFTDSEVAILTAMIGIVTGLIRVIEVLISRAFAKKRVTSTVNSSSPRFNKSLLALIEKIEAGINEDKDFGLTPQQAQELHELYILHSRVDQDGTPIWYVPRSWFDLLQRIIDQQHEFASNQRDQLLLLKSLQDHLDKRSHND